MPDDRVRQIRRQRTQIRKMADRYSEPGARWLPNLPVATDQLRELIRDAFLAGAHYQRKLDGEHTT